MIMNVTGNFINASVDLKGVLSVTFSVNEKPEGIAAINKMDNETKYAIEVKPYHKKRGLTANGYYWVLIPKLAAAMQVSNSFVHNLMLCRYGTLEEDMTALIPDTEEAANAVMESETYHLKPTSQVVEFKDGVDRRTYRMIRGSHTYDSAEFSRLLNGLIDECKHVGIETRPPAEIAHMMEQYDEWKKRHTTSQ